MDSKTYVTNAVRTESVPTELKIDQTVLHSTLEIAIAASQVANQIKRLVYFNKGIDREKLYGAAAMLIGMSQFITSLIENDIAFDAVQSQQDIDDMQLQADIAGINLANLNPRTLHAALGLFSEAGESVELIKHQFEGNGFDPVKFADEMGGDISWYQAIGLDAVGLDLDDCRDKNIAKLRVRFPEKFDAEKAVNRDLAAERAAVEGKAQ